MDLFPTAHVFYGYNDLASWRNLENLRLGAQAKPLRKLAVRFDYHSFWLADTNDGLYNVAGRRTVVAPTDEVDATYTLPLTAILTLGGGIGHMCPRPFLESNTPGSGNTFTFLFLG